MSYKYAELSMDELEARLRKVGAVWFRNDDLLLLEELLRRARRWERAHEDARGEGKS